MLQIILEPIFEIVFIFLGLLGYVVGVLPVMIGSLGTLEPGPFQKAGDFSFYRSKGMKWWHSTYRDSGRTYLPAGTVALIGWLLVSSTIGLLLLINLGM